MDKSGSGRTDWNPGSLLASVARSGTGRLVLLLLIPVLGAVVACDDAETEGPSREARAVEPVSQRSVSSVVPDGLRNVASMTVSETGEICIADTGNRRVVIVSEQLELLGAYGSPGQGPGELEDPTTCIVGPDQTTLVLEAQLGKIAQYGRDDQDVVAWQVPSTPRSSRIMANGDVVSIVGQLERVRRENVFTGSISEVPLGPLPPGCYAPGDPWQGHIHRGAFDVIAAEGTGVYRVRTACDDNETVPLAFFDFNSGQGSFVRVNAFEDGARAVPADPGGGVVRRVVATAAVAKGPAATYLILAETQSKHFGGRAVTGMQLFRRGESTPERRYLYSSDDDPIHSRSLAVVLSDGSLLVLDLDQEVFYRYSQVSLLTPQTAFTRGANE